LCEHRRACIDPRHDRIGRVVSAVPARADTGVEELTAEILKHQWPQRSIASALERCIQPVVKRRYSLVSSKIRCHQIDQSVASDIDGAAEE
jgi:hypothetical protein